MYLATVLDCCTKKAVGYAIGATARGIGSGVRGDQHGGPQVPVHDRGRRSSYPGPRHPGTPSPSLPTTRRAAELALRWEGPGCAERVPGRKPAGATLKEREGLSDGPHRKKQDRPGCRLPGRARHTSQTQPHSAPGHRTQDEADQKHRVTRQTARDTPFKTARDTLGSPSPAGNLADSLPSAKTPQPIEQIYL